MTHSLESQPDGCTEPDGGTPLAVRVSSFQPRDRWYAVLAYDSFSCGSSPMAHSMRRSDAQVSSNRRTEGLAMI